MPQYRVRWTKGVWWWPRSASVTSMFMEASTRMCLKIRYVSETRRRGKSNRPSALDARGLHLHKSFLIKGVRQHAKRAHSRKAPPES